MFTGIIHEIGTITRFVKHGSQAQLKIDAKETARRLCVGDSVAVCGVCLTATEVRGTLFTADVSFETLDVTTIGSKRAGDVVNLELPVTPDGFLGGHLVSGHVEGVGVLIQKRSQGENVVLRFSAPADILEASIPRGSMAIEGVSLTITDMDEKYFEVVIIPHTLRATNLGSLKIRDKVNLEADLIGRYVIKAVRGINGKQGE